MREIWDAYITEVAWRDPGADLLAVRAEWHARHGLARVFPFPWGDGAVPAMPDPFPEAL